MAIRPTRVRSLSSLFLLFLLPCPVMPIVAVIPRPNAAVELREISSPELEPDSALLEVELSEVCGTDVYLQQGRLEGVPYPLVPGHVSVGRLSKIRGNLLDVEGRAFREGDRVTFLDVHRTCNACWHCLVAKATTRCPHRKVYGITYGLDDGLCGGWAEQIYLKPRTRCIRLEAEPERFMAVAARCRRPCMRLNEVKSRWLIPYLCSVPALSASTQLFSR